MRELGGFVRQPFGARPRTEFGQQQRNRRQIALQAPGPRKVHHERRVVAPLEGYPSLIQPLCGSTHRDRDSPVLTEQREVMMSARQAAANGTLVV